MRTLGNLLMVSIWVWGGDGEDRTGQDRATHQQGVDGRQGVGVLPPAGALPGAGQRLHLVYEHHHEGGGLGQPLLHHVEHPLDQPAGLALPLHGEDREGAENGRYHGAQAEAADLHQKPLQKTVWF